MMNYEKNRNYRNFTKIFFILNKIADEKEAERENKCMK